MDTFFQQLLEILKSPSGSLTYHLVLAFAVVGAFQSSVNHWRQTGFPQGKRMVIGLSLMLGLQLIQFAASVISWQGVLTSDLLLPPLERAVILMSIIIISWLWCFPEPSRLADAATLLLGMSVVAFFVFSLIWWSGQPGALYYNQSWLDWAANSLASVLLSGGLLMLLFRRPNGWGIGLGMLGLLLAGHAVSFLSFELESSFSGMIRLSQMAAFPLLLALPQRFTLPPEMVRVEVPIKQPTKRTSNPQVVLNLMQAITEISSKTVGEEISRSIAELLVADMCLLVTPLEVNGQMTVSGGYNLIQEKPVEGFSLDGRQAPLISTALSKGRPLRLPASSTSGDLLALAKGLNQPRVGHMLAMPVGNPGTATLFCIILLSPFSNRAWTAEDQQLLSQVSLILARILHNKQTLDDVGKTDTLPAISSEGDSSLGEQLKAKTIENEHLARELRLVLEEVATMKTSLFYLDQELLKTKSANASAPTTGGQSEVIASMAQELRQPMSSILGYTDLLLVESAGILGALQRKFLERIKASVERMGGLTDDLIQLTTIDSGELTLSPEMVDLSELIDEAVSNSMTRLREKNIILRVDLPDNLPKIHADRDALQQILLHLLQNAEEATETEGEIALVTRVEDQDNVEPYILFQVTDSGGGIPSQDLPRVFSRLYRADNPLIQGVGDTGVGLSIVKTLVEAHGGRVWVDSIMGSGSTFSVLLPITEAVPTPTE